MQVLRIALFLFILFPPTLAVAQGTRFLSPLEGAQVIGPTRLEVATSLTDIDRVEFSVDRKLVGVVRQAPFAMVFDFGETLSSREVGAVVYYGGYRRHEQTSVKTALPSISERLTVDLVELSVRLQGRVESLPRDLILMENGRKQNILEVRSERPPTTFFFAIDRSLSMADGKLAAALQAVGSIRRRIRATDAAQVMLFNHRSQTPVSLTTASLKELAQVHPSGGTALRDALSSFHIPRRATLIVISDGDDRNSTTGPSEALRRIGRSDITVHSVLLGQGSANSFLREVTKNSGGLLLKASARSLSQELNRIFDEIDSRKTLIYQSTNLEAGWRPIEVASRKRGVHVHGARPGYYAR